MSVNRSLYAVGRVIKPFGIRGDLVVQAMSGVPNRFQNLRSVLVGDSAESAIPSLVERSEIGPHGMRVKLSCANTRSEAEEMVGSMIFVEEKDRMPVDGGTYFVDDLIGMAVVNEAGEMVGPVTEVLKLPAQDVYVIATQRGEVMVPAVRDFIRDIDLGKRRMVVHFIKGMINEDED